VLYWVNLAYTGFKLKTLVVIGTDCIYKPNYHDDPNFSIEILKVFKISYH